MNTKIYYQYCDADNYKVHNECIIQGVMTEEQKKAILDSLYEGEFFIPSAVGLAEKRFDDWTEADHPWFRIFDDSFEETAAPATNSITCVQLVAAFSACSANWEAYAFDATAKQDPLSVAQLIQNAAVQAEMQSSGYGTPEKTEQELTQH